MTFMLPGNELLCGCDVAWLVLEPSFHELIYDLYASRQWAAVWLWCGMAGVGAELAWTNIWSLCFQAMTCCVAVMWHGWCWSHELIYDLYASIQWPTFFFKEMSILGSYLKFYVIWTVFLQNSHEQRFFTFSQLLLGLWYAMSAQNVR